MMLLIMVAIQRREGTVDRLKHGVDDRRQRYTVNRQSDPTTHREDAEQQNPVIGVFLLVNVDHLVEHQWNRTLDGPSTQVGAVV